MCRLKVKRWKKIYHGNRSKGSRDSYINFRQITFRTRKNIRDKEQHYIMIEGSSLHEDIIIFNGYMPENRFSKCEAKPNVTAKRNRQIHC